MTTILVVDDHSDIRELLGRHLRKYDYKVSLASDAREARDALATQAVDLVVLDIMMPDEDGISLCRDIRATSKIPVIFLTSLSEETDRIIGLEVGADDYLTKPFSPRELVARIKTVLRRTYELPPQSAIGANKLRFERWVLNVSTRELIDDSGVTISLSTAEFDLLSIFLQHPHHTFRRDQLLELARGRELKAYDRSIDNQVSRLRRKLERDPKAPELITTIWGGGYSFNCDVEVINP